MRFLFIFIIALTAHLAFAKEGGGQEGGGGGYVHDRFIAIGQRVLYFLKYDPRGSAIADRNGLNLCRLRATLGENQVFVQRNDKNQFLDRRGSAVDGFTFPWRIYLNESIWQARFENSALALDSQNDTYRLVFKEMIRSEQSKFNKALDISNEILPFPTSMHISSAIDTLPKSREFMNWLDNPGSCLTVEEQKIVGAKPSEFISLIQDESPLCQNENNKIVPIEPIESGAAFLIYRSFLPGCKLTAKACHYVTVTKAHPSNAGEFFLLRGIERDGQTILTVPHTLIQKDGTRVDLFSDFYSNSLNSTMLTLIKQNICLPNETRMNESDWSISELGGFPEGTPPFSFMSDDSIFKLQGMARYTEGKKLMIGKGSRIRLVDSKVLTGPMQAKFIKVQVVENTISSQSGRMLKFSNGEAPFKTALNKKFEIAKPGDVGYVGATQTKFFFSIDWILMEVVRPTVK